MRAYFLGVVLVAALAVVSTCYYIFQLRLPVTASYGIKHVIAYKKHLIQDIHEPTVIIFGGSSVFFGFDSAFIEKELGHPVVTMGLIADLRLEDFLRIAREVTKPGDTVVMALEAHFYTTSAWTSLQLRNGIAWDHAILDSRTLSEKIEIYRNTFNTKLFQDLALTQYDLLFAPEKLKHRLMTPEAVVTSFTEELNKSGEVRTGMYYEIKSNIRGDIVPIKESTYRGKSISWDEPKWFDPTAYNMLKEFIQEMKSKNVQVYFAHFPYGLDGQTDTPSSTQYEATFTRQIKEIGSELIDTRAQLRFPYEMQFDSYYHLNALGRHKRSQLFIDCIKPRLPSKPPRAKSAPAPSPSVSSSPAAP